MVEPVTCRPSPFSNSLTGPVFKTLIATKPEKLTRSTFEHLSSKKRKEQKLVMKEVRHHLNAILMGVVRHDVNTSAGNSAL